MGDFGDFLGGLDAFSGQADAGGIVDAISGLLGVRTEPERAAPAIAHERRLCGARRDLNVNDR